MNMTEEEKSEVLEFTSIIIPLIPKILIKYSKIYLRFKTRANAAGKIFKNELLEQGVDRATADKLTELYMKSSKIQNFFKKK